MHQGDFLWIVNQHPNRNRPAEGKWPTYMRWEYTFVILSPIGGTTSTHVSSLFISSDSRCCAAPRQNMMRSLNGPFALRKTICRQPSCPFSSKVVSIRRLRPSPPVRNTTDASSTIRLRACWGECSTKLITVSHLVRFLVL